VKPIKIAVDFDGTCVTHAYPEIGKDIGAVPVLKRLTAVGNRLILNTMRSGKELQDAVDWFKANGIPLYGVNEDPGQKEWTQSPKVFANLYIDDAALGAPLIMNRKLSAKPFIDWAQICYMIIHEGEMVKNHCTNPSKEELYKLGYTTEEIKNMGIE
jgi:hypothetical protein